MQGPAHGIGGEAVAADQSRNGAWVFVIPLVAALAGAVSPRAHSTAHGTVGRDLPNLIGDQNGGVAAKAEQGRQLQAEVDRLSVETAPVTPPRTSCASKAARWPLVGTQGVRPDPQRVPRCRSQRDEPTEARRTKWPAGRRRRGDEDPAPTRHLDVRGAVRQQHVAAPGDRLLPPYVMNAIGDSARLRAALDQDGAVQTYREWVDAIGLGWYARQSDARGLQASHRHHRARRRDRRMTGG